MTTRSVLAAMASVSLLSCAPAPTVVDATNISSARPLDTLPAHFDPVLVRRDLLATASDRFGSAALNEALAAPTHLIVKRFAGMAPPPPPSAGPWRAPTPSGMLVRKSDGWIVASESGWRPVNSEAAAELNAIFADPNFWSEPAYIHPCPDFGASMMLLQVPARAETVRNSTCMSIASRAVEAALRA